MNDASVTDKEPTVTDSMPTNANHVQYRHSWHMVLTNVTVYIYCTWHSPMSVHTYIINHMYIVHIYLVHSIY